MSEKKERELSKEAGAASKSASHSEPSPATADDDFELRALNRSIPFNFDDDDDEPAASTPAASISASSSPAAPATSSPPATITPSAASAPAPKAEPIHAESLAESPDTSSRDAAFQGTPVAHSLRPDASGDEDNLAPPDPEKDALHSLYKQAVHLTEPEPVYAGPETPITRMTQHELRAMRAKSGVEVEVKVPFKETVANFVIRSFDELMQTFRRAGERRLKCLDVGHECIHCGKQFAIEPEKGKGKK